MDSRWRLVEGKSEIFIRIWPLAGQRVTPHREVHEYMGCTNWMLWIIKEKEGEEERGREKKECGGEGAWEEGRVRVGGECGQNTLCKFSNN